MYVKKFLKNSFFMFVGRLIIALTYFITIGIYAHYIGSEGFGVIGLVTSFIAVVTSLDISFYLPIVISINKFKEKSSKTVNKIVNSIFFFSWIINIFLIPLLVFIVYLLCLKVYSIPYLFNYFLISIIAFALLRSNIILLEIIRVLQKEKWVQIAQVISIVSSAILTIYLLIFSKLGLYSIFIGILFAAIVEFILSVYFIKKLDIKLKPEISFHWIKKLFKEIIGYNYVIKFSETIIRDGSLLISSIFLTITHLGMLTITTKILTMILGFIFIIPTQLLIIFSSMIQKKDYMSIKKLSLLISNLNIIISGFIFLIIFTVGDRFMLLYLGDVYNSLIFKIIIVGFLLSVSFISFPTFLQLYNISLLSKIRFVFTIFFIVSAIFILKFFGLVGMAILISLTFLILMVIQNIISFKKLDISFKELELNKLIIAILLILIYLLISTENTFIDISTFLILLLIYLICSFKSFKNKLKQLFLI